MSVETVFVHRITQELVKELERIERTNAALVSTKATLESELLRFKEYMRDTGEDRSKENPTEKGAGSTACVIGCRAVKRFDL